MLPDIVTSTTNQSSIVEGERVKQSEKKREKEKRRRMTRCLQRFYRMKLHLLEEESR